MQHKYSLLKAVVMTVALCASNVSMAADARMVPTASYNSGCAQTPLALSFFPGFQLPGEDWDVGGLRLDVFVGRHNNVYALDIGGLANLSKGENCGIEVAGIYNQIGSSKGLLQVAGIANYCKDSFVGLQIAPINVTGTVSGGWQIGLFNRVEAFTGLQLGLVNYAYQSKGAQIGLLNIISDSMLPVLPIVNLGF